MLGFHSGEIVGDEKEKLDAAIEEWKQEQMRKAFFGFFKALFGLALGIITMQPEIAGAAVAGAAAEAEGILAIGDIFGGIVLFLSWDGDSQNYLVVCDRS